MEKAQPINPTTLTPRPIMTQKAKTSARNPSTLLPSNLKLSLTERSLSYLNTAGIGRKGAVPCILIVG